MTPLTAPTVVAADSIAPNTRRGGDLRVMLSPKTVGSTDGFGGIFHLAVGDYIAEHYHPYSDEYVIVTEGQIVVTVNGVDTVVSPDEGILIVRGSRHRVTQLGPVAVKASFFLSPLAPRPELGHVETEIYSAPAPLDEGQ